MAADGGEAGAAERGAVPDGRLSWTAPNGKAAPPTTTSNAWPTTPHARSSAPVSTSREARCCRKGEAVAATRRPPAGSATTCSGHSPWTPKIRPNSGSAWCRPWNKAVVLYHHEPGSLARKHWRYLHEPTAGSIAALHDLIWLAAVRAVRRGVESISRELLDSITMSYASEVQYAKVVDVQRKQRRRTTTAPATTEQAETA
ncbi:MAG: hypothetical protein ABW000_20490 [Actinoplanes sp.]